MSKIFTDEEFLTEVLRRLKGFENQNWIYTHTGVKVFLANPSTSMIDIRDIAQALSNLCRFSGQCRKFFSVAEHSVLVAMEVLRRTEDRDLARSALMHDSPETYLVDVTAPLKQMLVVYNILELRFEKVIKEKFDLLYGFDHPEIKRSDYEVFFAEMDHLFDLPYEAWGRNGERAKVKIECWEPQRAKERFLEMAIELGLAA
jgi:hypothetical protein